MKALTPLRRYRAKVIVTPFLKLFEVATELVTPFLVRYLIDEGILNTGLDEASRLRYVLQIGGIMLGLALAGFLVTMTAQYLAARVAADYGYDLRKAIYHQSLALSEKQLNAFGKQKALTLLNNDAFSMQNAVMMFMRLILRAPFLLMGSWVLSFVVGWPDWRTGLIFGAVLAASSTIILLIMLVSPKRYAAIQGNLDQISVLSNDSLKGARPIRAFNKEDYEKEKFQGSLESYQKKNMGMAAFNALVNPLTFCFIDLGMVLIVYLGQIDVNNGALTTGKIVSLISYLVSSLAALIMFSRLIVSINKARASKKRIDRFFSLSPSIENKGVLSGDIDPNAPLFSFEDVALSYGQGGEKDAVEHLTFSIPQGAWVGLIGGTGSGKSTTLALMERLYDPTQGKILYGGKPLADIDLAKLRKDLSVVSQKPALFKGTIQSNLLLAKPDATPEEIQAALTASLAAEFVSKFPEGLAHPIEEGGANLSGGQKQRLLIARALLKGGRVLLLDDATSALDYLSDQQVRANISQIPGLTKIIVSQRASSLQHCDLILVYENGEIIAQGNHEQLLASCPLYKDIYDMQRAQA